MAPRKRKAVGGEEAPAAKPQTTSMRMTRRATRQANLDLNESATELAKAELPKKKAKKAKPAKKPKKEEVKAEETDSEKEKPEGEEAGGDESEKRTIVIEHCKQCSSFKTRANLVKDGLEKDVAGITVLLNPEKPRRGCFEIREEGGETFISLLDMKRPFIPMKELDMNKVISDIVEKLK
ncbi:selenoprotein H-like [Pistacia vera]|uniref:Uncharacterized protein n=1 Tax=Pistacia atlantica TaxID=434234 RepID=A0ACC1AVI3_9ROSI|nr:selenoprotein H-like [Pistacia vera]XP_031276442.1 selenoprotein H-like [Pistacia vera]KAJ0090679.1 hypothetical protein Patl1_12721 [Pistacia atlantica]